MHTRAERIRRLLEQTQLSYQDLEKLTGIKRSSLQRYATGVTTKIPLDVIEKLSSTFGVSQAYLMGWDEKPSPTEQKLSEGEQLFIDLLRTVPADKKPIVLRILVQTLQGFLETM